MFKRNLRELSNHNQPFFSVVIPCHNCENWIEQTLDSVVSQDFKNFELIVVDDGSTDGTVSVIEHWVKLHPEVCCLVKRQPNRYQGAARNTGIRFSRGTFVAFLDADDIWSPSKLSRCFEELESHPDVDVVCHNEWLVKNGIRVKRIVAGPYTSYEDLLFRGNALSPSATVVRKEWLERVNGFSESPELFCVEDYDLWLRLAREGANIFFINEPLGDFVLNSNNTTVRKAKLWHQNYLNLLERHYVDWPNPTRWQMAAMKRFSANSGFRLARAMANEGDCFNAWRLWGRVFFQHPISSRGFFAFLVVLLRSIRAKIHNQFG